MDHRHQIGAIALAAALASTIISAPAQDASKYDPSKYPDWSGQWRRAEGGPNRYDPGKPPGRAQEIPLTAEYQAVYEAGLKDQAAGGQGNNLTYRCIPGGMPRVMTAQQGIEFIVMPKATYVWFNNGGGRRIYTDGRAWPEDEEPAFVGYSIGKWLDTDNDGRFDTLDVETRNFKGPRTFDGNGHPLHADNKTVIQERIYLDKADPALLHNDITTIDNALSRPYLVNKAYRRDKNPRWVEASCAENNQHVVVGKENYYVSADGYLMPARKGQAPPDLRYFKQSQK
jgi:hypothetical protein